MSYATYQSLNNLETAQVVGGSECEFEFDVFDEYGAEVNLAPYTITWIAKPYGKSHLSSEYVLSTSITKDLSITNRVSVKFTAPSASKKWLHQIILAISGKKYKPAQGIILVVPEINTV